MMNKMLCCSFTTVFVIVLVGWIGSWTRVMKAGNEAFLRGNYDEARTAFQRATLEKPDNSVAHYNLGTALYKQGRFREAARTFQTSLSRHFEQTEDILNRSSILYNLGNAQFKVGDLTSAIDAYTQTLRLDPQDTDAQHKPCIGASTF